MTWHVASQVRMAPPLASLIPASHRFQLILGAVPAGSYFDSLECLRCRSAGSSMSTLYHCRRRAIGWQRVELSLFFRLKCICVRGMQTHPGLPETPAILYSIPSWATSDHLIYLIPLLVPRGPIRLPLGKAKELATRRFGEQREETCSAGCWESVKAQLATTMTMAIGRCLQYAVKLKAKFPRAVSARSPAFAKHVPARVM
jgi:hypothetical protein